MNLASRDIRHNLGRFVLTTIGLGMLLMIVMGMGGIYRGFVEDATLLIDGIGGDLWIVQRDTRGPFAEISRVSPALVDRVRAVPGVQSSREFVFHTIQREHNTKSLRMAVLGLSWPQDRGEWVELYAGRPLSRNRFEMIADATLGLSLGEEVPLGRETYKVVGLTRNMLSANGDGIAFLTVTDAQAIQFDRSGEEIRLERAARRGRGEVSDLANVQPSLLENADRPAFELPPLERPRHSAVVVKVRPGFNRDRVASTISGWSDVSVHSREDQHGFLLQGTIDKVRRQIGLFRILLTVIAGIIMALILYTLTLDKLHSIALLKLIGAPNRVILSLILQQALILGAGGFGLALLIGRRVYPLFPRRVVIPPEDVWQLGAIVFGISVASSILGIWKALNVSPNEAIS
ncbi:MAG: ABC transporter permease [Planctomycetaceae bacterium]